MRLKLVPYHGAWGEFDSQEDDKLLSGEAIHRKLPNPLVAIIKSRAGSISPIHGMVLKYLSNQAGILSLRCARGGEQKVAHAHIDTHQLLIAESGSFEVLVDDGLENHTYFLNRPHYGLHIPPGIWASEINFSSGAICLVLASHGYDAGDYIRNYQEYLKMREL